MYELIKHFEGYEEKAYQDTAGVWTIGYGHTKNVKPNDMVTLEQADKFLLEDLKDAEERVKKALPDMLFLPHEFEALVSLAYNLRSFEILAAHLRKDRNRFKEKMLLYCRDIKKNYLRGLKIRRICERLLFEGKSWLEVAQDLQNKNLSSILKEEQTLFS